MKKLVLAITLVTMMIGGAAMAQNPYLDNIGVYFDAEATEACLSNVDELGMSLHHVYVVLTQMTAPGVGGFELNLAFEGPLMAMAFTFPEGSAALNLTSPPSFLVGFGVPIPAPTWSAVLMEFDIWVSSVNPVNWDSQGDAFVFVKEIFFHSLPEPVPAYLDLEGVIKPMHQATGTSIDPVMIFSLDAGGCGNVVSTDDTSWDSLKSLYR